MKRTAQTLLLEGVMVVSSVLLALALNAWYEGQQEQERANAAEDAIRAEVRLNLDELRMSLERIRARSFALDSLASRISKDRAFYPLMTEFDGFYTPDLQNATWQRTLRQPFMARLPREFVEDAFTLYDWNFDVLEREILDFSMSDLAHTPGEAETAYSIARALTLEDVRFVEELIRRHDAFLEEHGDD